MYTVKQYIVHIYDFAYSNNMAICIAHSVNNYSKQFKLKTRTLKIVLPKHKAMIKKTQFKFINYYIY